MKDRRVRGRRGVLAAIALGAAIAGALTGADRDDRSRARNAGAMAVHERSDLTRDVGARLITRMRGTMPSRALLRRVRKGRVAGVILFADNISTLRQVRRAVERLQAAARAGGGPPLLILADQEGGAVKRFASLPPARAPREMRTEAQARAEGAATGRALRSIGVTVDLAPVVDVTSDPASFVYPRSFGGAPGERACAFAAGLRAAGVTPTLKHFPGLGGAPANTDDRPVTLARGAEEIRTHARPYADCGGTDTLVMVASATYTALGRGPALFERATYRLLRELGATAATVSDDLQARALRGRRDIEVRALHAGLDLLLFARTEAGAAHAHQRIVAAVRAGRLDRATLAAQARSLRDLRAMRSSPTG